MLTSVRERGVGLYAPGIEVVSGGWFAREVKAIDPDLVLVFNRKSGCLEVYDAAAPGGPKWQFVKRLMNEAGHFRAPERRDLDDLRRARRPVAETIAELEASEAAREADMTRRARELGEGLADEIRYLGKRVVPTVTWRDRTPPDVRARLREQIRTAASPREVVMA